MKITGMSPPTSSSTSKPSSFGIWMSSIKQVGLQLRRGLHRFEAVRAFRHDLDVGVVCQPLAKDPARQLLVIDDDHANDGSACDSLMLSVPPPESGPRL